MPLSGLTLPVRRWLWAADAPRPTPVERIEPPPEILAASGLDVIDHTDAFVVSTGKATGERDAEAWARAFLEGAPLRVRLALLSGWTGLGLRLDPRPGADRVLGWSVRRREPDLAIVGAESILGLQGELVLRRGQDTVTFSTLVRTASPTAQRVWSRVVGSHLSVVPNVLGLWREDPRAAPTTGEVPARP